MMKMNKMISSQVLSGSQSSHLLAIGMLAIILQLASSLQPAYSAPIENAAGQEQDDFSDDLSDLDDNLSPASGRSGSQKQHQYAQDEPSSGLTNSEFAASLQGEQYSPMSGSTGLGLAASTRGVLTYGRSSGSGSGSGNGNGNNNHDNYNSNNDDSDSDADEADSDIESSNSDQPMQLAPASGRRQQSEALSMQNDNESSGFWPQSDSDNGASSSSNGANNDDDDSDSNLRDGGEPHGLDSNIANAKIEMTPTDMATAAGHHHHHHGHGVHGWLEMGAKTGKKGAFKWHDKHPVGGKGRR